MSGKVLVLNAGSSTLKAALFDGNRCLWRDTTKTNTSHPNRVKGLIEPLWNGTNPIINGSDEISVVGHRVVHGGTKFTRPTILTAEVKSEIRKLADYAPLHNPINLHAIEEAEKLLFVPHVAVFDTAFHATVPEIAAVYPLPFEFYKKGIKRFGFHGINHQHVSKKALEILGNDAARMITCHLGSGCSLAAIRDGKSVDTTMGFTPLEGLMMGTRSGSIDPGIIFYLERHSGLSISKLDELLNTRSGILGISGISPDFQEVENAANSGNTQAKLAIELFIYSARKGIGAMTAALGGVDVIVFTGGIGQNSPGVREKILEGASYLQDAKVLTIEADEEKEIAAECLGIVKNL